MKSIPSARLALSAALVAAAVVTLPVAAAYAEPRVGGESSKLIDGVSNVPCNGVIYPVAVSKNYFDKDADVTQVLVKGTPQTLTAAKSKSETNQVAVSQEKTVGIDWSSNGIKASLGTKVSRTFTQGETVTFTSTNSVSITPKVDKLHATPTYFMLQANGATYQCKSGGKPTAVGAIDSVKIKVAVAMGWVITRSDGKAAVAGKDY
ncbi:MAG: hypothetical protein ACRC20_17610 [Segniliparus sp.]